AISPEKEYLSCIYELVKSDKPMTVETIAEKYAFDSKNPDELFLLVGNSIVDDGYAVKESGKGLFKNKVNFIPNEAEVTKVIEKLRAEFLEQGKISDEVVVLGALLNKSGLIKKYFSKYEVQKLNERLKEVRQSEAGILINKLIEYIDTWIVLISVIGS
ncbi:MAG: GPP34 family phosphoprotein, partial [Bacillota bacterium]